MVAQKLLLLVTDAPHLVCLGLPSVSTSLLSRCLLLLLRCVCVPICHLQVIQLPQGASVSGDSESYGLRAQSGAGSVADAAGSGLSVSQFARHAVGTKRRAVDLTGDEDDGNEESKTEESKDESYVSRIMAQSRKRKRQRVAQVVLDEDDDDDDDEVRVRLFSAPMRTGPR